MGRLSEHHKPKAGVEGKCSVPMWMAGCPSGFCDKPAYGEQYNTPQHAPGWFFNRDYRPPFAMGLCCKEHGGPGETDIRFMRDGNMWCAFLPGFENLQESIAGFGPTQDAAEAELCVTLRSSGTTSTRSGL